MMIKNPELPEAWRKIIEARHHDPFDVLGKHPDKNGHTTLNAFLPHAHNVTVGNSDIKLKRIEGTDFFQWQGKSDSLEEHYRLQWVDDSGKPQSCIDPYSFPPQIPEFDLHLFGEGKHWHAYQFFGANHWVVNGIKGILFATWAPNANRVSIIGDFNRWDGRRFPMRSRGGSGVWELFVPELHAGMLYKFEIRTQSGNLLLKSDPYAKQFEVRPKTAAVVAQTSDHQWADQPWMEKRARNEWLHAPMSIYEIHLGSWRKNADGSFLNYRDIARQLVPYVKEMGFTHIELLPITEHPLDASWGYQTVGYFAPTSRFGSPDDFRFFVDYCHQHNIGILLDWVPAHFPTDSHGLARFDGTALYEHEDPRKGEHRDWGTYIFNFGRNEVKNLLIASALYWMEEFHLDGIRVDAVASMLYLDYSREAGDWIPNQYGGRENLEAIDFLRELNTVVHQRHAGALVIAEESTAWPAVSRPTWLGGLGFSMKWNMGWMHDTLQYMSKDPVYRQYEHDQLTFGLLYAFTENFVLPFSHDEVVHGKGSLRYKMPGDEWQQFANLRLLYTYMFTYPGKKLLFMGCEFGQGPEWNNDKELDWYTLEYPLHRGLKQMLSDINHLYQNTDALHRYEFESQGFEWIDCRDSSQSILSYVRRSEDQFVIVILNFTPIVRHNYRIGVPKGGNYREIHNSDSEYYGGSNVGNGGLLVADNFSHMGRPCSLSLTLPPLAGIVLISD